MDFGYEYNLRKEKFENYLERFVSELEGFPEKLFEAVKYSLPGGGKRLRPILLMEAARIFCGEISDVCMDFAVAVECIHTYSLIHDDLPCMDNDDFRRGRPTCHKKFGEANAVLAGDAILNLAYQIILHRVSDCHDNGFARAGTVIADAAGGQGLIGGQVCDLESHSDGGMLDYIYRNKTGALIKSALTAGALIGGATEYNIKRMEEYGELFGYCFQLRDDLLDKDTDSADKYTYYNLYGEKATLKALEEKTNAAIGILNNIPESEFLIALTRNFMTRKS